MQLNSILNETRIGRIYHHVRNTTFGTFSAYRSDQPARVNKTNHEKLMQDVKDAGFGYIPMVGHYEETLDSGEKVQATEPSLMIISDKNDNGRLKGFLRKMGEKYNQETALYKDYESEDAILIHISTKEEEKLGPWSPTTLGKFFSEIGKNKGFRFQSVTEEMVHKFRHQQEYDKWLNTRS